MAEQVGEPDEQAPEVVPLHPHGFPDGRERDPSNERRPRPEPLLRTVLGRVIRQARHDQHRTLADVAEDAGISMPYLSEIERGRKEPSSELLAAVGQALGLDLLDLVARSYLDLAQDRPLETAAPQPLQLSTPRNRRAPGRGAGDVLALAA